MADPTRKRVVVTGLGVVTPLGQGIGTFWENLSSGQCGIGQVTMFDTGGYACTIAGEVRDFDPTPAFPSPKEVRRTDRFTQLGMMAGWEALNDSGLDFDRVNRDRVGAFIGSGIGGLSTLENQHKTLLERGPGRMSPFFIPMMIINMASGMFSLYHGLRGPNLATCSACATASHAIGEAWRTLVMGDADAMFAGGTEAAITPVALGGFAAMKALSTRNDDPQHASRPFDAGRDGFVIGEGAGVLVLEELEHARARGARIYCEMAGYGNTADAHHMTSPAPGGEGGARGGAGPGPCMPRHARSVDVWLEAGAVMAERLAGATPSSYNKCYYHNLKTKTYLMRVLFMLHFVWHIAKLLEIDLPIQKSSEFNFVGKKTDLLIEMCQKTNADIYLSGEGGRAYVDDTKFKKNNLKNYFTNFKHPIYKQLSEPFIPKMSTIDLLLNYDLKTSKKIIKGSGIIGE